MESEDEAQERWHEQFQYDSNGRRVWEPDESPPRSPTEAELDKVEEQLRRQRRP
jgi:hypothetical protein